MSIEEMWRVVEEMVALMGYEHPGFEWQGPLFKPEHRYLTHEGYPLGTTCWYVHLELNGERKSVCADTPQEAVRRAAEIVRANPPRWSTLYLAPEAKEQSGERG